MDEVKSNPSSGEQVVVKSADEQRKTEKQQPTNDNKFEPAIKILRQRKKVHKHNIKFYLLITADTGVIEYLKLC